MLQKLKVLLCEYYWKSISKLKKRKSNFHNLILNTVDLHNKPDARTVVLRSFSQEDLTIGIHTDNRSEKVEHLKNNNFTCLVFYDDQKNIFSFFMPWTLLLPSPC